MRWCSAYLPVGLACPPAYCLPAGLPHPPACPNPLTHPPTCRSDFESDDDQPKKPVPEWARGKALMQQLVAQVYVDPDEVFQQHQKTCSLDDVFASHGESGAGAEEGAGWCGVCLGCASG